MVGEHIGWDPLRIEVLWGRKEAPRRGPKPALTVEQIARSAIQIADDEGLDALSMQRLARDLGVGTMTLYTYVHDKATLLEVMFDRAFDEVVPTSDRGDWRGHLEQMAQGVMAAYQRHPWALQIFVGGPPLGPNQVRGMEGALRAFEGVDIDDAEKLDAIMAITSFVSGAAHLSVGLGEHVSSSGLTDDDLEAEYARAYATVLDPEQFPATVAVLARVLGATPETEADDVGFQFGLSRLLDGIEHYIASRD